MASVLVVDDGIENLRLLSDLLGEHGYEVRAVTTGRQALQAVEHDPPDLILLDINMPEMNGFEVCRLLRAKDGSKDVPVIFLSALTDTADKVRAFDAGGVDYVTKPFQVEEVLARVKTHIALRRAQADLADSYTRLRALENYATTWCGWLSTTCGRRLRRCASTSFFYSVRSPRSAKTIAKSCSQLSSWPRSSAG